MQMPLPRRHYMWGHPPTQDYWTGWPRYCLLVAAGAALWGTCTRAVRGTGRPLDKTSCLHCQSEASRDPEDTYLPTSLHVLESQDQGEVVPKFNVYI